MSLIEKIGADFMTAFKASKNDVVEKNKKNFLGLIKSTLTEKTKSPSDDEAIALLKSMLKKHNSSVEEYGVGTLTDFEVDIIGEYLPEQYTENDIEYIIKEIISGMDDNAPKNSGFVMGMFQKEHKGKADNSLVNTIIKDQLR